MIPQLPEPSGLLVYGFLRTHNRVRNFLLECVYFGMKTLPKAASIFVSWFGLMVGFASTGILDFSIKH